MYEVCEHEAVLKFLFNKKLLCQECFAKSTFSNGHDMRRHWMCSSIFKMQVLDKYEVKSNG